MKIDELNQNSAVAYLVGGRTDRSEPTDAHSDTVAKQSAGSDKVELSSYMPVAPASKSPQDIRASRVAEVKAQMANGSYQVSSRAVAEKMLYKSAMTFAN
jgi:negative regulator of flagellin synthesis FlgM